MPLVDIFVWCFAAVCIVLVAIILHDGPKIKQKGVNHEKCRYRNVDS